MYIPEPIPESFYNAISVSNQPLLFYILTSLTMLVISSTFYDVFAWLTKRENPNETLKVFSLFTNAKTLFNLNENKSESISAIHGIRSISIISIIFCHAYWFRAMSPYVDQKYYDEFRERKVASIATAAAISVDSFFVLSGALITRSILKELDRSRLKILKSYFQRFMRLTPCLALVILLNDYLITLSLSITSETIGHNESAEFLNYSVVPCRQYWLATIFHVQNYANPFHMCMHTTWYLSVEYQMFLIAPLFVYALWKTDGRAMSVIYSIVIAISFYALKVSLDEHFIIRDFDVARVIYSPMFQRLYNPTHVRGATYLIGIILGYHIYYKDKKNSSERSELLSHFYTFAAVFVLLMPLTITNVYDILGRNVLLNGLFISIARPNWGIAIAWIVYSCHTGLNKPLNALFSWKFWIPIGRMGLSIYLLHPIIQVNSVILQNKHVSLEATDMLVNFLMDVIITMLCAVIMFLFVEEPFSIIGKFITRNSNSNNKAPSRC